MMREHAGHSQVRMGEILGRSQRSISYIEFGTTRLDLIQLMEWCEACDTDVVGFVRRMKQLAAEYRVGMPLQRKSS